MRAVYPTTYLIAANELDLLKNDLKSQGLVFKEVQGSYTMESGQVVAEPALVVVTNQESFIKLMASKYDQESVLKLDGARNAELLFADGRTKSIGIFKPVTREKALASEAYTYDAELNIYYTTLS